jgi:hypothetical protein
MEVGAGAVKGKLFRRNLSDCVETRQPCRVTHVVWIPIW